MSSKLIHDYFNNNIIYYKVILVVLFVSFYEMTSLACLTLYFAGVMFICIMLLFYCKISTIRGFAG